MLDPLEVTGYWWLPENPEYKIPGTLRFSQEEGGRLELLGLFSGFDHLNQLHNPSIILGFSKDGKPITLHRCYRTAFNIKIPGIDTSAYLIHTIFHGAHFQSENDITFKSISMNYTDLKEWVGIGEYEVERDDKEFHVHYHRPDPIAVDVNDDLQLSLIFTSSLKSVHFGTEVSGKQETFFKLESIKGEMDFQLLQQGLYYLSCLLMLAVMRLVYPVHIIGLTEKNKQEREGLSAYLPPVDIYYHLVEPPIVHQPLVDVDMLFTFGDIQPKFEDFIKKWFSITDKLKAAYDLYFGSLYSQRLSINHHFLNIIQGLETYHRFRMNNQVLPEEEHHQRVLEILAVVPKKYHKWLEGLLKPANQPSLKMRLWDLTTKYKDIITPHVGDREVFISTIVGTRNSLTHHSKSKKAITAPLELYNATRTLTILLESALLEELGFSLEEIVKIQKDRTRFPM